MKTYRGLRGLVFSLLTLYALPPASHAQDAEPPGPDLTGLAQTSTGDPLPGARVFIYTAAPRVGAGILCPSCYADCRKQATTDAAGRFKIETLSPNLIFRVLVAAPGYQPTFVASVDPSQGPIEAKLKPKSKAETPDRQMRGRVTDLNGKPISGAVVNIRGVTRGESTRFGGNSDVDPLAVSDDEGFFTIDSENSFKAIGVDVEARGFAKTVFQRLESGGKVHELQLGPGATIKGRLVKDGKPAPHFEVGISGSERRSEIYVGNLSIATDAEGKFLFSNVTPSTAYEFYGIMKSLGSAGCVPTRTVRVEGHESVLDLGDIKIEPAHTVAGVVRLTDNKPLPEKTRVLLGREKAWDSQQLDVDEQGRFKFEGVPAEGVSISVRVKDYRYSDRNASVDPLNGFSLIGQITGDKTDLLIELEPGARREPGYGGSQIAVRAEPLRGAEKSEGAAGGIAVSGTVTDADSGQPIKTFALTEGRFGSLPDTIDWIRNRRSQHADGRFTVHFQQPKGPRALPPAAVMIEAEGYIPQKSGRITGETNLTFALKKGTGPSGIVLKPDGSPATNVRVYLTDMRNGVYVSGEKLEIRERSYPNTAATSTDEAGKFSFPPSAEAWSVIVLNDAGFAEIKVSDLRPNQEIRLQPLSRLEGKLKIGTKPGANETIQLSFAEPPYANHPRNFPALSFYGNTTTDAEGNFVFPKVPPIKVSVYHSPKARDSRTGTIPQSQITKLAMTPGKTERVILGGLGRPIIGKIVVTGYEGKMNWRNDVHSIDAKLDPPAGMPDMMAQSRAFSEKFKAAKTDEEKEKLRAELESEQKKLIEQSREFYKSPAGWEHFVQQRRYALVFSQDGSFRIEDVPGGKYNLRLDLRDGDDSMINRFSAPAIARLEKELEIPGAPGERSDEPFDLGVLEVAAKPVLKAGKLAPEFQTQTVDGKTIKLSDYKGKYLLLDFWAVWCGPCIAETPFLKETYEAFKDNPNFAMVGLSLDPDKDAPIQYQKKNKLGWTQGFLGDWAKSDLPSKYGVEGIPAIFLIGPDGTILNKDLRGAAIKQAVQSALSTKR